MKATLKTRNNRILIEVQAELVRDLFKQLAAVQEAFDSDTCCGLCHSTDIRYQVRTITGNDYYELRCEACGATMQFGQHKTGGTLFRKQQWRVYSRLAGGSEGDHEETKIS